MQVFEFKLFKTSDFMEMDNANRKMTSRRQNQLDEESGEEMLEEKKKVEIVTRNQPPR